MVTGAGSGIGRAVAVRLAGVGFDVGLIGRREAALEATAALVPPDRPVLCLPTDVGEADAVAAAFDRIERTFGRLDVLFNNAGQFGVAALIDELDPADWDAVVRVNLTGAFLCTQQAMRLMKRQRPQGGRIVNNGSLAALAPRPGAGAYAASKHGLTGLTRATALEGREHDIACGQIDIGNADVADGHASPEPHFDAAHVADAVAHMAQLPLDVNVLSTVVMATKMPFLGRG